VAEVLDEDATWAGDGDLARLHAAGDPIVNGDFLRVVKDLHFELFKPMIEIC